MDNLFADLPITAEAEQIVALLTHADLKIERIVSTGQASPPGFWYDQPHGEWVLVLRGEAKLAFEDEPAAPLAQARGLHRYRSASASSRGVDTPDRAYGVARRALRRGCGRIARDQPGKYNDVSKIFISYRRADAGGYAGRIVDRLCREFGDEAVFRDVGY